MNYSELVAAVVDITDRGENPSAIQYAVAKATLKFHLADFWLRDVVELVVPPEALGLAPRYEIYVSTALPGFRKISYINAYDDVTDPENPLVMQTFTENSPAYIKDVYGNRKQNVYYLAGDVITLWAWGGSYPSPQQDSIPKFLIGYYKSPLVQASNYSSWIAEIAPFAIVDEACAEIFGAVGDDDQAKRRRDMFAANLQLIRINDVQAAAD